MPSVSEKQREAMAIAEHEPSKLYKRNASMKKMTHKQLHDFASKSDHSWNEWENKKERFNKTGSTAKGKALKSKMK